MDRATQSDDQDTGEDMPPEDEHGTDLPPFDDAPGSHEGGTGEAGTDDGDGTSGRPDRRRSVLIAIGVLILLALGVGSVLAFRDDSPPPTSTTTTERATTTTRKEPLPLGTFEIATTKASVTDLTVRATPPEAWATAKTTIVPAAAPTIPPASQDAVAARDPLPDDDFPIKGRYTATDGWTFSNPGPYDPPQPFTMLVTERRGDWVKVLLPVRPNHTEGYVSLADVDITTTNTRIEVNLTSNTLVAYDGETVLAESPIVAGSPFTQTPTGRFYITDIVPQTNPEGAYGPFALATNGYSEVMDEFDTGVPVVALHGTNAPDKLGTDVSNGCIRLPNDVVTLLAERMPLGTPVFIWP
ncbi:MAG: L,D-transpeptidase [Microthrixaceae bacterium]